MSDKDKLSELKREEESIGQRLLLIDQAEQTFRRKNLVSDFLYLFGSQFFQLGKNFRQGVVAVIMEETLTQAQKQTFSVIA